MFNLNFIAEAMHAIDALSAEFGTLSSFGPGHAEAASAKLAKISAGLDTGAQVLHEAQIAFAKPSIESIAPVAEAIVSLAAPKVEPFVEAGVEFAEAVEHAFALHPAPAPPATPDPLSRIIAAATLNPLPGPA